MRNINYLVIWHSHNFLVIYALALPPALTKNIPQIVTNVPSKVKIPGSLSIPNIIPYAYPTRGVNRKAEQSTNGETYFSTMAEAP